MQSTEGTESAAPIELPQASERRPRPPRSGRLLGALGCAFGLCGLAAAGFMLYLLHATGFMHLALFWPMAGSMPAESVYFSPGAAAAADSAIDALALARNANRDLTQELDDALAEQARLRTDLQRVEEQQSQALQALQGDRALWRQEVEDALAQRFNALPGRELSAEREWQLAEVEFLLRMANRRLLMEWDLPTALQLLQAADAQLAALNEDRLHEVRAVLADEILRLRQRPAVDLQGLYLRLDAIKRQLAARPRFVPQPTLNEPPATRAPSPEQADDQSGLLAVLVEELASLVRFRRLDADFQAPPSAAESAYLALNLGLMLEQAQLAILKRDPAAFAASLDSALHWAAMHFDAEDAEAQERVAALRGLRAIDLGAPPPDISGSLRALRQIRGAAG